MPVAVEDAWTKVTRNDSDFSLCVDQTLTSPIQMGGLWCRAQYRGVVYPLSIPAGPGSIQPLHLCLVHTSCQEALCTPLEMQAEQEVTRRDFLYHFGEICLWLCEWGSSLTISWSNHRRPWSPQTCSLIHSSFIHSLTGIYRILDTVVYVSLWGWWLWSLHWLCLPFIWWYLNGVSECLRLRSQYLHIYKAPAEIEGALSLNASMETSYPMSISPSKCLKLVSAHLILGIRKKRERE